MRFVALKAVISVLALAGCAQQRIAEADAALTQHVAECKAKYPSPAKDNLLRARCDEPARRANFAAKRAAGDLNRV